MTIERNDNAAWIRSAILFSIATVCVVAAAMLLPQSYGMALLIIFVIALILVLWLNPKYRFIRAASSVTSIWLAARSAPSIAFVFTTKDDLLAFSFSDSVGWSFDVGCAALAAILFILDYVSRRPDSRFGGLSKAVVRLFSKQDQHGSQIAQQTQIGDVVGDNNQIRIQNIQAKRDYTPEIDTAASFIEKRKPDVALEQLERLQRQCWDELSDREKYRILANLGHARTQKDEHRAAAKHFIEAVSYQPNDEQALALEAGAYLSIGEEESARAKARQILEQFPHSEVATSITIRTAPVDTAASELEASISPQLRDSPKILDALFGHALTHGNALEAVEYAQRLAELDSESLAYKIPLAIALVQKAMIARQGDIEVSQTGLVSDAETASVILTDALDGDWIVNKRQASQTRYYRAMAYELMGQHDLAEADFRSAVEPAATDSQILFQFALFLLRHEKVDEAGRVLERISSDDDVGVVLMRATLLTQSSEAEKLQEAEELFEKLIGRKSELNQKERFEIFEAAIALYRKTKSREEVVDFLKSHESLLEEGSYRALLAIVARRFEDAAETRVHAKQAAEVVGGETPRAARFFLGKILADDGEFEIALGLLKPITTTISMREQIELALTCAHEGEDYRFLLDFCEALRLDEQATELSTELEVMTREKLSDYGTALEIMDAYLARPDANDDFCRSLRLRKSLIGKRLCREDLVEYSADKLPETGNTPVEVACFVAQILTDGPAPMTGVQYAYRVLRQHFDSAEAHICYCACAGVEESDEKEFPQSTVVEAGYAVHYREEGKSDQWVVLEEDEKPDSSRQEVGVDSRLAKELLGKKVGDTFYIRRDPAQDRIGTIVSITHKLEFRRLDVFHNFEDRFPDENFVRGYKFETQTGELDVEAFHRSLRQLDEGSKQIDRLVATHGLSAGHHSQLARKTILESVLHLAHDEDALVRCCRGTDEEYAQGVRC